MKKYKNHTVQEYLNALSKRTPTPGGGSAAALTAATGAALISMVSSYSMGKGQPKTVEKRIGNILKQSETIRKRLITMIDLDAEAYMAVVKARGASKSVQARASRRARNVPKEVGRLCYKLIRLTPYLVDNGNKNLLSDVVVAVDLTFAAYNAAKVNVEANQ